MKVTKELLKDSQAKLTIELSVEEAKPYVEKAAERIAKEVDIKGFRKGKVPYDVLKQNVGEQAIYEEAFSDMVEESYQKALAEQDLDIAGRADIDREKLAPGNPVVYTATVPLMPKMELADYKTLKAKKEEAKFDEKKYERTVKDIQKMRAKEKLVDREAKTGDKVVIDFEVKIDGVVIEGGKAAKQHLVLGEGQMIPGFEEEVVGMKKNEEKDFTLNFPKDYKKELAGKEAAFHIKLHDVYEMELPELTDEVAKEMNFESLKNMEEEIRANIQRELDQEVQEKFEVAVLDELIKNSTFDPIAPQLLDEEAAKMMRELQENIMQQGLKFEDYLTHMKKTEEELKNDFQDQARKRIQAALIMREVAKAEEVKVEAADVDKEINDTKAAYKNAPNVEEIIAQIESPQYRVQVENAMIHRKTFEALEGYTKK